MYNHTIEFFVADSSDEKHRGLWECLRGLGAVCKQEGSLWRLEGTMLTGEELAKRLAPFLNANEVRITPDTPS